MALAAVSTSSAAAVSQKRSGPARWPALPQAGTARGVLGQGQNSRRDGSWAGVARALQLTPMQGAWLLLNQRRAAATDQNHLKAPGPQSGASALEGHPRQPSAGGISEGRAIARAYPEFGDTPRSLIRSGCWIGSIVFSALGRGNGRCYGAVRLGWWANRWCSFPERDTQFLPSPGTRSFNRKPLCVCPIVVSAPGPLLPAEMTSTSFWILVFFCVTDTASILGKTGAIPGRLARDLAQLGRPQLTALAAVIADARARILRPRETSGSIG